MTKKPRSGAAGQIRIIGGLWRGRKLPVPDSEGLRPTTDRVRETLFNWLAADIQQAKCLDCFAGSGALGLEALSRHAGSATLLELERPVAQQLEKNLATLGAKNARVVNTNTLQFLAQKGEPHQLVFIDPPFRKGLLEQTSTLLESNGWLSDDALVYVESEVEHGLPPVPVNWQLHREKIAGQVAYRLYIRHANDKETSNVD
ncbi:16S rRNA methyltransferase [bacteria symbiont BFo1 of Frankliniella occidentalis]|jgi:16S rRNA (guanine966-N2)-methyltransferase|uniref:Ribosomal RNA small subunit methyltransferase D n=1 Tax=Erwinia aphidicola TaxID=68334 RepID=A0ABU8DD06_ERWAP|nr:MULTISPECIES: 16S rRNA (guanine(966)-N(2))-methyltransferase [Erwinia]KMV68352.1 16S rRNA methyltransferase [bacteria symbiont BFo1 of Frankliniella occidentalis]PIJ57461.1 16S rRNA (guanine(966)-N(2))-methyltransferase [Erwinia sp. OLMDLW33]KYP83195.1 16S rRNA methyltransferase [bacteria symbiont BFo1 of Frankliniella occidentalis]KYP87915.1 16S rRNA methyltransferase [bacteria symbiont BFo1 of Frankliniella occidentalis]MBD1377794.1 16S rRNA (guanine(966)-N(2))-methyltransferase [Erwinia 